ncbi:hypothetical protein C9374_003884 [Naegleria lovaniensis]|uniref:Letm1 RBD domain-containing protein n=1 Tax=Naegleria lovaniensis TaxID=51637 RepID=A0AA88KYL1_NAELO|nr:uncharacterized protein C9374_003884 [Naegleria lovaniensis]KAG2394120.1 hypothetical protein C9374_003884 [Naegleria lovaniensis]
MLRSLRTCLLWPQKSNTLSSSTWLLLARNGSNHINGLKKSSFHSSLLNSSEQQSSQHSDPNYDSKKQFYEQSRSVLSVFLEYKQFLIGSTFHFFGDFIKYREMRKEISYRPFRVASRKELLFMNGFRFDCVKLLIPTGLILLLYPKLLLAYLPLCYYYPSIRPSYYQSEKLKKAIRDNSHQMRKEQRDVIIQEVLRQVSLLSFGSNNSKALQNGDESEKILNDQISLLLSVIQKINALKSHPLPLKILPNLDTLLKELKQLDQSELFTQHLTIDKLSDNIIDSLCRYSFVARLIFNGISGVFKLTNSGSIIGSRSGGLESGMHSLKYMMNHLFMGASATSIEFIRSMLPQRYKRKLLKYYVHLIREDDMFIHQVLDTMSIKELIEASYVRGFVHEWKYKFSGEEGKGSSLDQSSSTHDIKVNHRAVLVSYLKLWCAFSSHVQNDNLLLLVTVLLFVH